MEEQSFDIFPIVNDVAFQQNVVNKLVDHVNLKTEVKAKTS